MYDNKVLTSEKDERKRDGETQGDRDKRTALVTV